MYLKCASCGQEVRTKAFLTISDQGSKWNVESTGRLLCTGCSQENPGLLPATTNFKELVGWGPNLPDEFYETYGGNPVFGRFILAFNQWRKALELLADTCADPVLSAFPDGEIYRRSNPALPVCPECFTQAEKDIVLRLHAVRRLCSGVKNPKLPGMFNIRYEEAGYLLAVEFSHDGAIPVEGIPGLLCRLHREGVPPPVEEVSLVCRDQHDDGTRMVLRFHVDPALPPEKYPGLLEEIVSGELGKFTGLHGYISIS
jgi:hypothetical protein